MTLFTRWTTATATVIATVAALTGAAYANDPTGVYKVEGMNPGGESSYAGTVTVESTGETYSVNWDIGGVAMQGIGIAYMGQPAQLSVAFSSDDNYGIAVFTAMEDGTWSGTWAGHGAEVQGMETWTRQ